MRFMFVERKPFERGDGGFRRTIDVLEPGQEEWRAVQVWVNPDGSGPNCTKCSGPMSAMSGSCPHAKAAARWAKRNPMPTTGDTNGR